MTHSKRMGHYYDERILDGPYGLKFDFSDLEKFYRKTRPTPSAVSKHDSGKLRPYRNFFANVMNDPPPHDNTLPPHPVFVLDVAEMLQTLHDEMWQKEIFIDDNTFESFLIDLCSHLVFTVTIENGKEVIHPEYAMVECMVGYNMESVDHKNLYGLLCVLMHRYMKLYAPYNNVMYTELFLMRIEFNNFYYCLEDFVEQQR